MRFWLSAVYWNFLQGNLRKVLSFRGLPCGKACLSTVWSAEIFDFPRIILWKGMPFRRIILGKFWLSADFTIGKPALTQNTLRLHAFPRYNPRKVLTFRELYPGKGMPFRGIIHGKFWLSADYPQKVKLRARISRRIHEKILINFLTFIRDLLGVDSWKKRDQKISCYSLFKVITCNAITFWSNVA